MAVGAVQLFELEPATVRHPADPATVTGPFDMLRDRSYPRNFDKRRDRASAGTEQARYAGPIAVMLDSGSVRSMSALRSRARRRPLATLVGESR